jgi:hypothetical protein
VQAASEDHPLTEGVAGAGHPWVWSRVGSRTRTGSRHQVQQCQPGGGASWCELGQLAEATSGPWGLVEYGLPILGWWG